MGAVNDLDRCRSCAHYRETTVFELCMHSAATYSVAGKSDQHTIGHMRTMGTCRHEALYFAPIEKKSATRVAVK